MRATVRLLLMLAVATPALFGSVYPVHQGKSSGSVVRIRPPGAKWSVLGVAVSPDGSRVAVLFTENAFDDWARVYCVSSGKVTATLKGRRTGESLRYLAWHPHRPVFAIAGGHMGSPISDRPGDWGAFFLLDARSGKVIKKFSIGGSTADPIAWLPNGRAILAKDYLLDLRTGEYSRVASLSSLQQAETLASTPDWTLAADVSHEGGWNPTQIEVYRRLPGKGLRYALLATLRADKDEQTGKITSFCTQPGFLKSGRLAYARVFLAPDGERRRVELWTSRTDGRDERKWFSLPLIPREKFPHLPMYSKDYGKYRLTPVSWSRDGRTIAYAYKGEVHVKRLKPPAAK